MRTEIEKSFDHGFFLSEQEIRRILDWLVQQVERKGAFRRAFEIKFANGAIAKPSSLDEVVGQENIGSKAITRLKITVDDGQQPPNYLVEMTFSDATLIGEGGDRKKEEGKPIRYSVSGDDRDWVFVTASELDERIGRLRQFRFNASGRAVMKYVLPFVMILTMAFMVHLVSDLSNTSDKIGLEHLRSAWKKGDVKDPIEIMFEIDALRHSSRGQENIVLPMVAMLGVMILVTIGPLVGQIVNYLSPSYNFYWGEYITAYDRRKTRVNILLITIVGGVVASFIASWLWSAFSRK